MGWIGQSWIWTQNAVCLLVTSGTDSHGSLRMNPADFGEFSAA